MVLWCCSAVVLWRCGLPVWRCGAVGARLALWCCDLLVWRCGAVVLWNDATAPQHRTLVVSWAGMQNDYVLKIPIIHTYIHTYIIILSSLLGELQNTCSFCYFHILSASTTLLQQVAQQCAARYADSWSLS